jgi:hypothetical protein
VRKFLVSIVLGLTLALGGCASQFSLFKKEQIEQMTPVQKAQASIKQGYANHASITTTLWLNYKDGIITKAEKDKYSQDTRKVLDYLDEADDFVAAGDISSAELKLKLVNEIIPALQRELARQAAKERQ